MLQEILCSRSSGPGRPLVSSLRHMYMMFLSHGRSIMQSLEFTNLQDPGFRSVRILRGCVSLNPSEYWEHLRVLYYLPWETHNFWQNQHHLTQYGSIWVWNGSEWKWNKLSSRCFYRSKLKPLWTFQNKVLVITSLGPLNKVNLPSEMVMQRIIPWWDAKIRI